MNTLSGQFVTGMFTADAVSQVLTVTRSTDFAVANALTIGVVAGGGDTTPPAWIATWPQAAPLSTTSLTVGAKINEAGSAYYVVLPDGAAAPTAAQVSRGDRSLVPCFVKVRRARSGKIFAPAPIFLGLGGGSRSLGFGKIGP